MWHIFQNMDIYPKIWTQCQKSEHNHTKVNKILKNDIFGLSKSGIGYSVASTTTVSIFLASTAHNRARQKSIVDSHCRVPPTTLLCY